MILTLALTPFKAAANQIITAIDLDPIRDKLSVISPRRSDPLVKSLKNRIDHLTIKLPVAEQNRMATPGVKIELSDDCRSCWRGADPPVASGRGDPVWGVGSEGLLKKEKGNPGIQPGFRSLFNTDPNRIIWLSTILQLTRNGLLGAM
jgi:hypothetical protein